MFDGIDAAIQNSPVGRYFQLEERGSNFSTEFRGAVATFLTLAYILAVNPRIMSESGGPCVPNDEDGGIFGPSYAECLEEIKREFITSTAIASMFGCFVMGFAANLPIALAPGMGMNAYFTYSVVGWRGGNSVSYEAAVTAVLIEGVIFLILALTGVRYAIIKLIPEPVKQATPAGIGAFLAHLGLQTAEGIGLVVSDIATAVTLGGCPLDRRTPIVALTPACAEDGICVTSDAYTCDDLGGIMRSPTTWMGILGLMIMSIMLAYKNRWAFAAGIGLVTVISWFRNTAVTYFPDNDAGDGRFEYFKQIVSIEPIDKVLTPFTGDLKDVGLALFTFLYVDFLDTSGTLLALADSMGFIDENGDFPKSRMAFSADAIATMFGALFGLSPVTSFIESGAGVEIGARTGLCAIICGFFFLISIFFSPILASIPPWASGGSLVIVGAMMCRSLKKIKWHNLTHALSAFVTVMLMPLTYSIAYGLIGGMFVYLIMEGTFFLLSLVGISKPEFEDTDGAVEYTEGATKKELEDGEEVEEVAAKEADTVKKDEEEGPIDTEG